MTEETTDEVPFQPARPTASCGCGHSLIWCDNHWEHDAAPFLWGDDHEPDEHAPSKDDPARIYWDKKDGWGDEETLLTKGEALQQYFDDHLGSNEFFVKLLGVINPAAIILGPLQDDPWVGKLP
jgi:hypothetical protein